MSDLSVGSSPPPGSRGQSTPASSHCWWLPSHWACGYIVCLFQDTSLDLGPAWVVWEDLISRSFA